MTRRTEPTPQMLRYPRARGRRKQLYSIDQLHFEFAEPGHHPILVLPVSLEAVESCFRAGCTAEDDGRFEEAVAAYQQALQYGNLFAAVRFNLANSLYAVGKPVEAVEQFKQAIVIDPRYCEAWNNLGVVLAEIGDVQAAEDAFRKCLDGCGPGQRALQSRGPVRSVGQPRPGTAALPCLPGNGKRWPLGRSCRSRLLAHWFPS